MDYFIGEIRMFAGYYAPQGWAICDGSLLSINDYQALYSLIGTTWGGDGVTTFGLPNLVGRVPIGQGAGTGLTPRVLGQTGGADSVTIDAATMPAHSHNFNVAMTAATSTTFGNTMTLAQTGGGDAMYLADGAPSPNNVAFNSLSVDNGGGGITSHSNDMPSLGIVYIIATNGTYPSRPS